MEADILVQKIKELPEDLQAKAEDYIVSLLEEAKSQHGSKVDRGYGSLKGQIWMSDDFNEPLEDFKDYM